jgi:ABC-type sugar transport system ATPase subunit
MLEEAMPGPYLLEVNHLSKSFAQFVALDDVSFAVCPGAIHVLLGEDGAGKTTVMRILGGAHPVGSYGGEVLLDGKPLAFRAPVDAIKAGIGVVLRRPAVFEQLTIGENVMLATWQRGGQRLINPRTTRDAAQALLDHWDIDLDAGEKAHHLSPVQQRLMMVARALSIESRLIALDEPLFGIPDAHGVSRILYIIRRMAQQGITCLYLARRLNEACQIGDRVTVLRDGTVAGAWDRISFDEPAMAQALISQRAGDFKRFDDEAVPDGGLFGTLQRWFRPG